MVGGPAPSLVHCTLILSTNRLNESLLFRRTFLEYLLHRFVFHRVPSGYWGITAHFLLHGVHHKLPADPGRLVRA